ncbi:hypothetical protein VN97_g9441 [Penicillium thymicola]|uniref:Uncharacterized protein n=1 Tax=Penicillium thymicola TaxID=293382 RepID=A0AAI9TAW2_PENTH|nr:hypothetical protein VN97_g9441 [Penicillium thymicola]
MRTYNSEDSLVVTHPTTNSPACGLSTAERTGSPIFHTLWSEYLPEIDSLKTVGCLRHHNVIELPYMIALSFPSLPLLVETVNPRSVFSIPFPFGSHRHYGQTKTKAKTYNSEDSLVVTHPTTNSPACGLSTAERTGSPVFHTLWSYVLH